MIKRLFFGLLIVLVMAGTAVIVQAQDDVALTITNIDWRPGVIQAGQETLIVVTYRNAGETAVPPAATEADEFSIEARVLTTNEIVRSVATCADQAPGVSDLPPGEENSFNCTLIIPTEGEYAVEARIMRAGRTFVYESTTGLEVTPYESALPNEIARLFAGLGMFAAVMAIVAVGTEVVIDSVKVALGMKRKVTTMEALTKMENLMPGQLASLGARASDIEQFETHIAGLKKIANPVVEASKLSNLVKDGEFGAAYEQLVKIIPQAEKVTADRLNEIKAVATTQFRDALVQLSRELGLSDSLTKKLWRSIETQIDEINIYNLSSLLDKVFGELQNLSAEIVRDWLLQHREELAEKAVAEIMRQFDDVLRPQLRALGMTQEWIDQVRSRLEIMLETVDTEVVTSADTYLASLNNLLDSVEARRFDTQSPMRKFWRRLRQADEKYGTTLLVILLGLIITVLSGSVWSLLDTSSGLSWVISFVIGFSLSIVIIALLVLGGTRIYRGRHPEQNPKENTTHLELIEILWNWLRGDVDSLDPNSLNEPRTLYEWVQKDLNMETAAQIVMERTDQQRDEESSRLRWLRVVSLIVGLVLAYMLQIDAAVLLDRAVPGAATTINRLFFFKGPELHEWISFLPATLNLTAGMVLTGLAASAGSTFWHDQLDRLQASKKSAETAAQALQQARQMVEGVQSDN